MANPMIELRKSGDKEYLFFRFINGLTREDAADAVRRWNDLHDSRPGKKLTLVWDCLRMEGYDKDSRDIWQNMLKEREDQIDKIWLITDSSMITIGAAVLSVFTSIKIKIVNAEEKVML